MTRIWDITEPLSEETAVWPGDNRLTREWVMRKDQGLSCNVSTVRLSLHCGTHADSPYHYDDEDQSSEALELEPYLGRCRLIEVEPEGSPRRVPVSALEDLSGVERLLIRTRPDHDATRFDEDFCSLGPEAAKRCVQAGLRLIGLDTPSMDAFDSKDLETHHRLRSGRIALLENLDLSGVPTGDYELIALPLRLVGADATPVRAVLRDLDRG